MMNEIIADLPLPVKYRHLQGVQGEIGAQVVSDLPPDDLAGKQISDESGNRRNRWPYPSR